MPKEVRIGLLGSGFIGEFHMLGLRYVPDVRVTANWGAGPERREAFAARFGSRALDSMEAALLDPEVDPSHQPSRTIPSRAGRASPVAGFLCSSRRAKRG